MKSGPKSKPLFERFQGNYIPEPNSGCWLWMNSLNESGYGHIALPTGIQKKAHRISWMLHYGQDPGELFVCHKCDNPCCVNPDHLFLGTQADNLKDCQKKNRFSRTHQAKGERQGNSKLTDEMVLAIRASPLSLRQAAAQWGTTFTNISDIRKRRSWRHV